MQCVYEMKALPIIFGVYMMFDIVYSHNHWTTNSMEDLNSRTDYLITIYSSTKNKPCFYFGKFYNCVNRFLLL